MTLTVSGSITRTWPSVQLATTREPSGVQATASGGTRRRTNLTIRPIVGCQILTVRSSEAEATIGRPTTAGRKARALTVFVC